MYIYTYLPGGRMSVSLPSDFSESCELESENGHFPVVFLRPSLASLSVFSSNQQLDFILPATTLNPQEMRIADSEVRNIYS